MLSRLITRRGYYGTVLVEHDPHGDHESHRAAKTAAATETAPRVLLPKHLAVWDAIASERVESGEQGCLVAGRESVVDVEGAKLCVYNNTPATRRENTHTHMAGWSVAHPLALRR